jgi:hypothetical protein
MGRSQTFFLLIIGIHVIIVELDLALELQLAHKIPMQYLISVFQKSCCFANNEHGNAFIIGENIFAMLKA